jgi:NADPH2:quinone reductase
MLLLLGDFAFDTHDFAFQLLDIVAQLLYRHSVEITELGFLCAGIQIVVAKHTLKSSAFLLRWLSKAPNITHMNTQTQQMMHAIRIREFGDPEVLEIKEISMPIPGPDQVLVRVHAAGVNRPDLLQRIGKYPPPPGITDTPGLEVAGEIVATGEKVCALIAGGGYAEYVAVPKGQYLPIPQGLSMIEAAALPETVFTVWNNVFVRGALQPGETLLIHGGASGIGTTAIQMAKAHGARVIVTAGSDDKCAACIKLGADQAVNYKTQDFSEVLSDIDVVLDMVGGDYVPKNLKVLRDGGRHVSIATLNGPKAEIDIRMVMQKRLVLTGSTLRARSVAEKTALAEGIRETVWPWIEAGKVKPAIYKTFPLAQAAQAHKALEQGDHFGKIVLTVSD